MAPITTLLQRRFYDPNVDFGNKLARSQFLQNLNLQLDDIVSAVNSAAPMVGTVNHVNNGGVVWGNISGTLSDQLDLNNALSLLTPLTSFNAHVAATGTAVHGLGTASTHAYTDFDAAGLAAAVQSNLTTHIGLTGNSVHGLGTLSVLNSPLDETHGGTNQTAYTLGDILYSSATNVLSKLAGNTTTALQLLSQTGTGAVSAAPAWRTVTQDDIINGSTYVQYSLVEQLKLGGLNVINGILNIADSVMSFVDGTRTFTIAPTGVSFSFYAGGIKYTKSIAQNVVIPNSEGIYYIYFDTSGVIQYQSGGDDVSIPGLCYVATVYWSVTDATANLIADERHGVFMNQLTHEYLHDTFHARYESGFALGDIIADASGNLATSAEFSVAAGIMWDEDLEHNISVLTVPAQIPIYYKSGAAGGWRRKTKDNYPLIYKQAGTNARADWNQLTGGSWQLTEIGAGNFVLVHYFATAALSDAIIGICGQAEYTTIGNAQAGATVELASIVTTGLPVKEFVPIATVIWQTSSSYANAPSSRIRSTATGGSYIDWRSTSVVSLGGAGGLVWGGITGTLSNQIDLQNALNNLVPYSGGTTNVDLNGHSITAVGGSLTALGTLALRDTSAAFDVTVAATSSTALTAGRTLTIDLVNVSRTLKLTGNAVLNQDVSTTGGPTFASLALGSGSLTTTGAVSTGNLTAKGGTTGTFMIDTTGNYDSSVVWNNNGTRKWTAYSDHVDNSWRLWDHGTAPADRIIVSTGGAISMPHYGEGFAKFDSSGVISSATVYSGTVSPGSGGNSAVILGAAGQHFYIVSVYPDSGPMYSIPGLTNSLYWYLEYNAASNNRIIFQNYTLATRTVTYRVYEY